MDKKRRPETARKGNPNTILLPNIFEGDEAPQKHPAGSTIFDQGHPGTVMYVVKKGEVDLVIQGSVVETVGPNEFFGEMALIDNQPRSAAAVARTDCTLVPVDQKRFLFMVDETPFFALEGMRKMSARLRRQGAAAPPM